MMKQSPMKIFSPEEMEKRICRGNSLNPVEDHPLKGRGNSAALIFPRLMAQGNQ
ncbi:MAG: hypothetical protein Ct9H300mP28_20150 [Pseudomonadota bacterium]|nr:MAG: hypothetical protein Ct9H300mP28_20150 [Pseudomonadota bacterium]